MEEEEEGTAGESCSSGLTWRRAAEPKHGDALAANLHHRRPHALKGSHGMIGSRDGG